MIDMRLFRDAHKADRLDRGAVRNRKNKYYGVCKNKRKGKYVGSIWLNGRTHHIGTYAIEEDAAQAVIEYLKINAPWRLL